MRISISSKCRVFPGEDGDALELHFTSDAKKDGVVLVAIEGFSGDRISAVLEAAEVGELHNDISVLLSGGRLARSSESAYDPDAPSLRLNITNRGEPYREGIELTLVYNSKNYTSVFLEQGEAANFNLVLKKLIEEG